MLTNEERERWAEVFGSLASEARLRIVEMLAGGRLQCQEILGKMPLSQPAISYHLAKLERAGVVVKERRGVRNCYRLSSDVRFLTRLLSKREGR